MYCSGCSFENPNQVNYCTNCGLSTLHNSLPIKSSADYAGFWKRFFAIIIDSVIIALVGAVIGAIIGKAYRVQTDFVINWLYFTLFECSTKQATIGKMLIGIMVTDLEGRRLSFWRANARYWTKVFSALIIGIGYIMAGFTKRKQALHDIIANTLVVVRTS